MPYKKKSKDYCRKKLEFYYKKGFNITKCDFIVINNL